MSKKIYLSPSNQTGNKYCTGNTNEGVVQNEIGKLLAQKLQRYDCEVKIADQKMTLANRAAEAKAWGATVYIALHSNAAGSANSGARGVSFYYGNKTIPADRLLLAQTMQKHLSKLFKNRGVVLSNTLIDCNTPVMPSVIGEVGFHDNQADCEIILTHKDEIAELYALGIAEYLNLQIKGTAEKTDEIPAKPEFQYYHVVKKGEWLSKIAARYSTTVKVLSEANNIKNVDVITVGQKIGIPGAWTYSVKKGDTLGKIAKANNTTVAKLVKANGILNANIIYVAQKIIIV